MKLRKRQRNLWWLYKVAEVLAAKAVETNCSILVSFTNSVAEVLAAKAVETCLIALTTTRLSVAEVLAAKAVETINKNTEQAKERIVAEVLAAKAVETECFVQ